MTAPRLTGLTRVQRDAIALLDDDWWIGGDVVDGWSLRKPGEASRHVRAATFESLKSRGIIEDTGVIRQNWTLTQPPRTPADGARP